ncbi:hypothetical protein AURDEDRAFT_167712 [Auricularia subglabra TFB-10046 SS5]|nr:hypothetical protein AURDEDRAFT_167712 [Auricularia subglabra TFB-10046 SS5]
MRHMLQSFVRNRLLSHQERALPRTLSESTALEDALRATVTSLEDRLASSQRDNWSLQQENAGLIDELDALRPLPARLEQRERESATREQELTNLHINLAHSQALAEQQRLDLEPLHSLPAVLTEREQALGTLRTSVLELERTISEQQTELDDARLAAASQATALTTLTHELDRLRPLTALSNDLQRRLDQSDESRKLLESELEDSHTQARAAQETVRARDAELDRLRALAELLEARTAQISELELNVQLSTRLLAALDDQLGRADKALDASRQREERQAIAAAALNEELDVLRPLPALVELLRCEGAEKDASVLRLESALDNCGRRLQDESKRAAGLTAQLDASRAQVADHEFLLQGMNAASSVLAQELQQLQRALDDSVRRTEQLETVISDQNRDLAALRPLSDQLSEQISLFDGLRCALLVAQQHSAVRESVIRRKQTTIQKHEQQCAQDAATIAELGANVGSLRELHGRQLGVISDQSSELEALRSSLAEQTTAIADSQNTILTLKQTIGYRKQDITELRRFILEIEDQAKQDKASVARLEAEAREARAARDDELAVQKARIDELQKELDSLRELRSPSPHPSRRPSLPPPRSWRGRGVSRP